MPVGLPGLESEPGTEPGLLAQGHLLLTPVGTDEERPASRCPVHFPGLFLATFFIGDGLCSERRFTCWAYTAAAALGLCRCQCLVAGS